MKKNLIPLFCILLVCLCACVKENRAPSERRPDQNRKFSFSLHLEDYDGNSKSAIRSDNIDILRDINVFVFNDRAEFCNEYSAYFPDYRECSVYLPEDGAFTIYFLANAGKNLVDLFPGNGKEDDLKKIKLEYSDYERAFADGNLPCMGKKKISVEDGSGYVSLYLKRLISKWTVTVDTQLLNPENCRFSINSLRVRNAAADIFPFCDRSVCTVSTELGDYRNADEAEVDGSFCLYTLENCQGVLLPESSSPKDKTYSNVKSATGYDDRQMSLLTFIELDARVSTVTADYDHVYYRFYLGEDDHSSFNVIRNRSTDVRIRITKDLVIDDDWRLSPDEPGEIHNPLSFSAESLFVAPGVEAQLKVKHPRGLDYSIEIPENEATAAGIVTTREALDATTDLISFRTTRRDRDYIPPYSTIYSADMSGDIYRGHRQLLSAHFKTPDGLEQKALPLECLTAAVGCTYTLDDKPVIMLPNIGNFSYACHLTLSLVGGNSGNEFTASDSFDFTIRPQKGPWLLWSDHSALWGMAVYGWSATPVDITETYLRLIAATGTGQELKGSISNLEIKCIEHPGLEIRLGTKAVTYVSSTGTLQNYPAWRMSCTGTVYNPVPLLMDIGSVTSGIKTAERLNDILETGRALHLVNGDFECEIL